MEQRVIEAEERADDAEDKVCNEFSPLKIFGFVHFAPWVY